MITDQGVKDMQDWVYDTLTGQIASEETSDFIVVQGDELVYVNVEAGTFYLISVKRANAEVAPPTERAEASGL